MCALYGNAIGRLFTSIELSKLRVCHYQHVLKQPSLSARVEIAVTISTCWNSHHYQHMLKQPLLPARVETAITISTCWNSRVKVVALRRCTAGTEVNARLQCLLTGDRCLQCFADRPPVSAVFADRRPVPAALADRRPMSAVLCWQATGVCCACWQATGVCSALLTGDRCLPAAMVPVFWIRCKL